MKTNKMTWVKFFGTLAFACCLSITAQGQKTGKLSNVERLTNDGERYINLQWSPDGSKLAFAKEGFEGGIEVLDVATKTRTKVTDVADAGIFFQWSADSKEILFRDTKWTNGERTHTLYVTDLKGQKQQVSQPQRYLQPASWRYAANGTKSVFTKDGKIMKQPNLPTLNASMTKSVTASKKANISTYNDADAQKFYLIDENGKQILLNNDFGLESQISPNGKKIIFNDNDYLILMDTDGKNRRDLGMGFRANWLNDNQIVYELTTDNGHVYTGGELYMVNIDGTNRVQLTNTSDKIEMYPTWNANTQKLAFISQVDGQIYVADLK